MDNLSIAFTVDATPQQAFAAITNVRGWWSGEIDGRTDKLGETFTYRYQDIHRSTQRISELVPGERVAWHIEDSYLSFVADKSEWNGTDVTFDITPAADGTQVRFTHIGLRPAEECYENCSVAWQFYIADSLRRLIEDGHGQPNLAETTAD